MSENHETCPNPKCKSADLSIAKSMQTTQKRVLCRGCLMTGPMSTDEVEAWEAWDALPRESKEAARG
ncbi:MAG: hypothetical protein P4L67_04265 [Candidatus Pacebacteria bacterium]|nr:hypothetical protein [Candidatus Paceibacterota bacterium]